MYVLPHEIVLHILSFLPIEEIVKMDFLSLEVGKKDEVKLVNEVFACMDFDPEPYVGKKLYKSLKERKKLFRYTHKRDTEVFKWLYLNEKPKPRITTKVFDYLIQENNVELFDWILDRETPIKTKKILRDTTLLNNILTSGLCPHESKYRRELIIYFLNVFNFSELVEINRKIVIESIEKHLKNILSYMKRDIYLLEPETKKKNLEFVKKINRVLVKNKDFEKFIKHFKKLIENNKELYCRNLWCFYSTYSSLKRGR